MFSLGLNSALSFYSIPCTYVIAYYTHFRKVSIINGTVGYDNIHPRSHDKETLVSRGMPPDLAEKITRYTGAHQNGNEMFAVWSIAVLAGNFAGLDQKTLNVVSGAFIALRLLFNYLYINQKTSFVAWTRTAVFYLGLGAPTYLLIKSANKLRLNA